MNQQKQPSLLSPPKSPPSPSVRVSPSMNQQKQLQLESQPKSPPSPSVRVSPSMNQQLQLQSQPKSLPSPSVRVPPLIHQKQPHLQSSDTLSPSKNQQKQPHPSLKKWIVDPNRTLKIDGLQRFMGTDSATCWFSGICGTEYHQLKVFPKYGYGYIEFQTREDAETVLKGYKTQPFMKNYTVSWAPSDLGRRSPCYKIVVRGLADDITDPMLKETFCTPYPSVKVAEVVTNKRTGRSEGYGFVTFEDEIEYLRAISEMNGKFCSTSQMCVQPATEQNIMRAQDPTEFLRKGRLTKTIVFTIRRGHKLMRYVEPDILHKIAVRQPVLCIDIGTETVSFGVCLGSKDGLDWPSKNWERSDIRKDAGFDQIVKCVVNWVNWRCIRGIVFGICTKSCDLPQKTCAKAQEVIKFVKDLSENGILKDIRYTYWSSCDAYSLIECMKMSNGWDLDIGELFEKSSAYAVLQTFLRADVHKKKDQSGPSSQ